MKEWVCVFCHWPVKEWVWRGRGVPPTLREVCQLLLRKTIQVSVPRCQNQFCASKLGCWNYTGVKQTLISNTRNRWIVCGSLHTSVGFGTNAAFETKSGFVRCWCETYVLWPRGCWAGCEGFRHELQPPNIPSPGFQLHQVTLPSDPLTHVLPASPGSPPFPTLNTRPSSFTR